MMRRFKIVLCILGLTLSGQAWSLNASVNANIQRILVTGDSLYGGCMALLDVQPSSAGLDCPGSWVTFSCSGDFSSRQEAQRVFDAAQLGYALNKRLRIQISDSQTHNGFCWARRVEVLPN